MNWIFQKTIKNYKDVKNPKVREDYGVVCSIFSILLNLIMVAFKLGFGIMTKSIAIQADGFNNLSDVGSNVATLIGFKLSSKHPDQDHPYGHGRIEYIVGMVISFLILYVGLNALIDAIERIIQPEMILFEMGAVLVLVVSIFIKLWMSLLNKKAGDLIQSPSLLAASQDSFNDVLTTFATLVCFVISPFLPFQIDGIVGAIVSIFVLKSGIEIFKGMMNTLLGKAPDRELIDKIHSFVMQHEEVIGIHDLMIHDYGPGRKYMTFHAEVDARGDLVDIHDRIDLIERELLMIFNILTTIHMDPIDTNDEKTNNLKKRVVDIISKIHPDYTIHDFRIVSGKTHTNLIFDVVLPSHDESDHEAIKKLIAEEVSKFEDGTYYCVIEVEHSYL